MSVMRHIAQGSVSSAVASSVKASVLPCTVGYAPVEEGGGGGGSTTYTFTINPAWFTYDPGEEYGGPQITESLASNSAGMYWLFQDQYYEPLLALGTAGTMYEGDIYVPDLGMFAVELGAALDVEDTGLTVTLTGDNSEIFTVTFTAPPTIGSVPVVYLSFYSESGSSPAFINPAELVTSP